MSPAHELNTYLGFGGPFLSGRKSARQARRGSLKDKLLDSPILHRSRKTRASLAFCYSLNEHLSDRRSAHRRARRLSPATEDKHALRKTERSTKYIYC